jgi:hypothetical protein
MRKRSKTGPEPKHVFCSIIRGLFSSCLVFILSIQGGFAQGLSGWKAGTARLKITPSETMWMAGYAARDHEAEEVMHDLWIKALALGDAKGKQCLIITADLLGFPKGMSDRIRDRIFEVHGLTRSQVILSSSHTHSGPVLQDALFDIYPLDAAQLEKIKSYSEKLEQQVVELAGTAIRSMRPARLFAGNGVTRFQVNRRNNSEATIDSRTELKGPNDYAVPVIKVENNRGELFALLFGYACHPTVLDQYKWSGDYPGFAQLELEKNFPGVMALFFQGAGGDQNPIPRRSEPLAEQYGKELSAAVERTLKENMKELPASFSAAYAEIDLYLNPPPSEEALVQLEKESTSFTRQWAGRHLEMYRKGKSFISSYPYPLQVWNLGDQPIMILGGELVIEYAIDLKRIFGKDIFVMGYANDVMAYIPSETILEEGGYEGDISQMVYGLPGKWKPGIQSLILNEMTRLAIKAGINPIEK